MDFDYSTETITPDNSGTLTIDGHIDLMGHWSPSTGSIAAAGSTQGTATPITTTIVEVSAATSGLGVILPVGPNITTGTNIYVVNTSIYAVNVYPPITGSINGLTKNLPVVVSAGSGMLLSITNMDGDFTSPAWITHTTSLVAGNNISLTHERGKITINGSAGGATLAIEAKDEGITLTSDLTSINFTGAGVTATNTGGDVTVDIPGGSSQSTVVSVNQTAHGFTKGTVVYFFEGTWYRVLGFLQEHITPGIVTAVINSNMFRVQTSDIISADDLPAGLVGHTRYYPSITGALVAENAITSTARLDVATGKLPPVLVTFADEYTDSRGIVNPPLSYNPPRNKFVAMYEPTRSLTALLWYRDHTNNNYALASASSISTLATHISVLPPDATDEVALGVSLYDIPAEVEYMFSLGISNQLEDLILAGSEGAKVYLSTVPGQVTLTPPAIRQVVGVLNVDGKVLWHVPYREVPNITVSTTAPSSPAIGDVWVDIS